MIGYFCTVKSCLIVFVSVLISISAFAQKASKVEVMNADVFEFVKMGNKQIRKLKGNCAFKQDNVLLYCDSALLYQETNSVDAFGHVHIQQGDSLNLYGDLLKYDGNAKLAKIYNNIRVIHNDMTLTTEILTYDTKNRIATYYEGGKIVNAENVLTSKLGYYYTKTSDAFFKKDVVLTNPKYVMKSDTLKYNTQTKISTFFGPTTIQSEEDFLYSENGTYNTKTDVAQFSKNSYYQSGAQTLRGDQLYYDRRKGIGRATNNIVFTDTVQKVIMRGNKANYHKPSETVVATDRAYVTMLVETDSLYLSADTLKSVMDTATKLRTLFAYHDAQIFKTDLRARCDSLVYSDIDSTIRCYKDPVMWSQNAQLTADFLTLNLKNQKMHKMNMYNAAFVVMVDSLDSTKFDQIRGKNMFGYFVDNKLARLDVEGNGQSVYYAKEDAKKDSTGTDSVEYIGVNRAECSNMILYFKDNKVQKVNFITKPDSTFYPIDELKPSELRLKGFSWREALKPKRKEDILR